MLQEGLHKGTVHFGQGDSDEEAHPGAVLVAATPIYPGPCDTGVLEIPERILTGQTWGRIKL